MTDLKVIICTLGPEIFEIFNTKERKISFPSAKIELYQILNTENKKRLNIYTTRKRLEPLNLLDCLIFDILEWAKRQIKNFYQNWQRKVYRMIHKMSFNCWRVNLDQINEKRFFFIFHKDLAAFGFYNLLFQ